MILRMLLARLHAPVVRFPYIINNVVGGLDLEESAEKVELFLIINELLAGAQVIYLADEGERRIIEENQAINKEIIKIWAGRHSVNYRWNSKKYDDEKRETSCSSTSRRHSIRKKLRKISVMIYKVGALRPFFWCNRPICLGTS